MYTTSIQVSSAHDAIHLGQIIKHTCKQLLVADMKTELDFSNDDLDLFLKIVTGKPITDKHILLVQMQWPNQLDYTCKKYKP